MLRKEQNDLLTQTGPQTAMGAMFRSYWIPALLSEELPENDCAPVRVELLSERLLAFRDSQGRYGLIEEFCAHRGVSLWFGRNEESGIRCPYHGWKYDVTGPVRGCAVRARRERLLPAHQAEGLPAGRAGRRSVDLHGSAREASAVAASGSSRWCPPRSATSPSGCRSATGCRPWKVASIPAMFPGCTGPTSTAIRCSRAPRATNTTWRTPSRSSRWCRPMAVCSSARAATPKRATTTGASPPGSCRVSRWCRPAAIIRYTVISGFRSTMPTCWAWSFDYHPVRALTDTELQAMRAGKGIHVATIPGTYIPLANKSNDYLMDRSAQKARAHFQRHRWHRYAGRLSAGEHGSDRRSHP